MELAIGAGAARTTAQVQLARRPLLQHLPKAPGDDALGHVVVDPEAEAVDLLGLLQVQAGPSHVAAHPDEQVIAPSLRATALDLGAVVLGGRLPAGGRPVPGHL
eukprot:8005260-Alexandrium_andersonii.AAC.1